jgi:hypothetical protein
LRRAPVVPVVHTARTKSNLVSLNGNLMVPAGRPSR